MSSIALFGLIAFVLATAVLSALVWPLVRRHKLDAPADEAAATAVFRDHKRQLDAELAAGTLSAADRDAAEAELVARFGDELAVASPDISVTPERSRWIAAIVLVGVLPATAVLLYVTLGNPAAVNPSVAAAAPAAAGHAGGDVTDAQIAAMVDRLAEKMKANPEDGKGWVLLGRSYSKLGRHNDAANAFAEAAKRLPESADLLTDQAEALAMAQDQRLAGRPAELVKRALALEPDHPKAIAMTAAVLAQRGDFAGAIAQYTRLKGLVPPNSEESQEIDQVLAELETARKQTSVPGLAAAPTPKAPPIAAPAAAAAPALAPETATRPGGAGIQGRAEIDAKFAGKFSPGDAVFIYARDPDGSRMPLAVMRATAGELPKAFALNDAMAMTPNNTISRAKTVVVEARISKSGNAIPQSGDLRGVSQPVKPGAGNVRIVIDQVVP
jgi:cytochrome c-type biogenesis protein CcmH